MGTVHTETETGLTCNSAYTRYAWAYNACGNSTPVTLTQTTSLNPPAVPVAGTHVPAATQIVWNWNTVSGATGYKWGTTNVYASATDMGTAVTKTETGLTCNTAYTRYAWAYSACGNSTPVTLTQTTSACAGFTCGQPLTDTRDNQVYATVLINTQCWMRQNLNIGLAIAGSGEQTNNGTLEKYCNYDLPSNCATYGGLYQWGELVQYVNGGSNSTSWSPVPSGNVQGICPLGWHLPKDEEWSSLTTFLSGTAVAGGKMKETGTAHWFSPNTAATNSSSFTAIGAGHRDYGAYFYQNLVDTFLWSATEAAADKAWIMSMAYYLERFDRTNTSKYCGLSVRCIKD
jgi:uncharacterized protein (TIGR02145 family)